MAVGSAFRHPASPATTVGIISEPLFVALLVLLGRAIKQETSARVEVSIPIKSLGKQSLRDVERLYCIRFGNAAPLGLASLLRAEWFFVVSAASVAAFALFEDRLFSRLDNPLTLTAILLWLFGVGAAW